MAAKGGFAPESASFSEPKKRGWGNRPDPIPSNLPVGPVIRPPGRKIGGGEGQRPQAERALLSGAIRAIVIRSVFFVLYSFPFPPHRLFGREPPSRRRRSGAGPTREGRRAARSEGGGSRPEKITVKLEKKTGGTREKGPRWRLAAGSYRNWHRETKGAPVRPKNMALTCRA